MRETCSQRRTQVTSVSWSSPVFSSREISDSVANVSLTSTILITKPEITINVPVVFMARYKWFWGFARAISGPKKVSIFRAHPFQCPLSWCCTPQNHYVPRHKNNRYIGSFRYPGAVVSCIVIHYMSWTVCWRYLVLGHLPHPGSILCQFQEEHHLQHVACNLCQHDTHGAPYDVLYLQPLQNRRKMADRS